ncbi:hypothetical protein, partial [Mesorhizobium sp. M7A.F.Ca.US.007.01.1.1]|uniref:hypothetical protein n=1 Tax=Mesorhizobium sp. M7A.F.Ca.US.007.01.1.1 TaxID=2496712 RepID=UPI0019D18502
VRQRHHGPFGDADALNKDGRGSGLPTGTEPIILVWLLFAEFATKPRGQFLECSSNYRLKCSSKYW